MYLRYCTSQTTGQQRFLPFSQISYRLHDKTDFPAGPSSHRKLCPAPPKPDNLDRGQLRLKQQPPVNSVPCTRTMAMQLNYNTETNWAGPSGFEKNARVGQLVGAGETETVG
jgi:hypothetical protein